MFIWWLELAQKVFGEDRLGWDYCCDGDLPNEGDFRDRVAGWMILKKKFSDVNED